LYRMVT